MYRRTLVRVDVTRSPVAARHSTNRMSTQVLLLAAGTQLPCLSRGYFIRLTYRHISLSCSRCGIDQLGFTLSTLAITAAFCYNKEYIRYISLLFVWYFR